MQLNKIIHSDCLEGLKTLPDKCCDIFTDPPFNVGKDYGDYKDNITDGEYKHWITEVLNECLRVSNSLTIYIPKKYNLLIWNILGTGFQEIILSYNPEGAIRGGFVNQFNKLLTNANPKGGKRYVKNVWHNIRERSHGYFFTEETFGHPGYTSESLTGKVIKELCDSDIICDPFMGTGTTAAVARKLGRNFMGFELNENYIKIAEKRLEKELGFFA